jgi:hypothetical protein
MATSNPDRTRGPKATGANRAPDREWFAEVMEAGELHAPDENFRPAGMLYDVQWQWEGLQEEINPEFFLSFWKYKSNIRRCTSDSYIRDESGMYIVDADWVRLRRPCLRLPIRGGEVCSSHGGSVPAIKEAAQRRLDEAAEIMAMRLLNLTSVRDEENLRIRPQDRLVAINSALDRSGIKGNTTVEVQVPGFKRVLDKLFSDDSGEGEE